MIDTVEDIKGRKSSIKIGATGKVSALMMEELDIPKGASSSSVTSNRKPRKTVPVSVTCGVTPKRRQPTRTSSSSVSTSCNMSKSSLRMPRRTIDTVHRIPMLASEDIAVDRTPNRGKHEEKRSHVVEIVDMNCGNSERAWSNPLKNLSFLRLSD